MTHVPDQVPYSHWRQYLIRYMTLAVTLASLRSQATARLASLAAKRSLRSLKHPPAFLASSVHRAEALFSHFGHDSALSIGMPVMVRQRRVSHLDMRRASLGVSRINCMHQLSVLEIVMANLCILLAMLADLVVS